MDKIIGSFKYMLVNWKDFSGKTERATFWYAFLADVILSIILSIILPLLGTVGTILSAIIDIVLLVPGLAITVRRLRDAGKSWANLFWFLLPLVGWIIVVIMLAKPSK